MTGDATEKFSIKSIAKVFNLAFRMTLADDDLWTQAGMEPSGYAFINGGALVVTDVPMDHLLWPNREMLEFVRKLRCSIADCSETVAASEKASEFNNKALINFMKAHANIRHDVDEVLDVNCHQCSIGMTCTGLCRSFLFMANGGVVPGSGERILTTSQAKHINAIMLTCGFL